VGRNRGQGACSWSNSFLQAALLLKQNMLLTAVAEHMHLLLWLYN
jgi:hypothetical protein